MISQTLRTIRECKSGTMRLEPPQQQSQKKFSSSQTLQQYIQEIKVIDCQRRLTQLSHSLEHRKT
jgi:Rap guanine nucleotide exchange factor 4